MSFFLGDGLGKLKDGIKEAIKPKRKANNLGLGFKLGAEFQDNWWEKVFDKAAANVNVGGESVTVIPILLSRYSCFLVLETRSNFQLSFPLN